jgi:hypothetical protein
MRVVWGKQLHGEIALWQMFYFRQTTILERERPPWGIYLVAGLGSQIHRMRLMEHVWNRVPSHCLIASRPDSRQNETGRSDTR